MDIVCKNRKAYFDYEILQEYPAGIVLEGTEVKSIRNGGASLTESFCRFDGDELFLYNSNVTVYGNSSRYNTSDPARPRKLLLNRTELKRLRKDVEQKGNTIVPLNMFLNERGLVKVTIALCRGKHAYDKRESIKKKDIERENKRKF